MRSDVEIADIRARLRALERERQQLEARLAELTTGCPSDRETGGARQVAARADQVTHASPVASKVALFRRLFAGRQDVHPVR